MPRISSAGLGSGLDVPNLVEQLVAAEGDPIRSRLDRKEVTIQEGLSAIGTFKGALLDFQSSLTPLRKADAFNSIVATSSNEDKFSVVASNESVTGSYDVEITQLAQSQKLKSKTFSSELDSIGSGSISIQFGTYNADTETFVVNSTRLLKQIEISPENNSLRDIQETINQSDAGVRASIVNDGTGYIMVLNAEKSGLENSMRISITDSDNNDTDMQGLSQLAYNPAATADEITGEIIGKNFQQTTAAKNALISFNDIEISSSENVVSNSIPGVTLTLKNLTENTKETLSINKNLDGVKNSIKTFVASYNELINTVTVLTGYDPESGTSGPLSGDSSIRGIIDQIRRRLSTSFNGINQKLTSLSSIGIDSSRDGTLRLDEFKLARALDNNAGEIKHLFSAAVSTTNKKISVSSEKLPTINGVFDIKLTQIPAKGQLSGLVNTTSYPMIFSGNEGSFDLSLDNAFTGTINVPAGRYNSGIELAGVLQSSINNNQSFMRNKATVTVNHVNNAFEITSDTLGSESAVSIVSINETLSTLLGLVSGSGTTGKDLKATVNAEDITGKGNKLHLEGALDGIVLEASGGKTGDRGELVVTNGIAAILDDLTDSFLENQGLLDNRIDGYNLRIKDIDKQRDDLVRKLEGTEERYLKQFSNLDAMLSKMRSTSNFLAEKLSSLPGSGRK